MFLECWDVRLFQTVLEHKALLPPLGIGKGKQWSLVHPGHALHPHLPYYKVLGEGLQGAVHSTPPHRCLRMGVMDTGV